MSQQPIASTSRRAPLKFQRPIGKFSPKSQATTILKDDYEKATDSADFIRKRTGIIYDLEMLKHKCEWDQNYPECPERMQAILDRINELQLEQYMERLTFTLKEDDFFLLKHTNELINTVKQYGTMDDLPVQEREASKYDAIYFNKETAQAAAISASCVNQLVKEVCTQDIITNGIAIVRPPGHHASSNELCGYCYYNNVALAAQDALDHKLATKILIVDYDVHHGQGTQRMFYNDNRVLYFSIHRYEHGKFWPNLRESNFDYIGDGSAKGYNINFPLNVTELEDDDYMAIILNILVPVAYEFQPDLILFSAGYDAAVGCFEGRMLLSPSFYGQVIKLLTGLAHGKLAVVLEGGYFLPSLAEGVVRTITALLDFPSEKLKPMRVPHKDIIQTINDVRYVLRPYWSCFNGQLALPMEPHQVKVYYKGTPDNPPYLTRNCYPSNDEAEKAKYVKTIENFKLQNPVALRKGICYGYDPTTLLHSSTNHPETPYRLETLMEKFLKEYKLHNRLTKVESHHVTRDMLCGVHTAEYVEAFFNDKIMYDSSRTDIYVTEFTQTSALASVNCLYGVVQAVANEKYDAGVALIRPPGHHAECEEATGFCFINNIAVMASYLVNEYQKKVLIVDWDIHHGNGTQHMFYENDNVLFISIHKFEYGKYYPSKEEANYSFVGFGRGAGYNVNIPFNDFRMRDNDYMNVFHRLVLPIAYSFAPDVILVSAGFDAGVHDRLGNYFLTPEVFGHFVQLLKGLAQSKIILVLEGGYNPNTVAYSMIMCIKALLGDPMPMLDKFEPVFMSVETTLANVINAQKGYWPCVDLHKLLPPGQLDCPLPLTD